MDLIELELMWASLRSIVNAQAKAMQRAAFSAIVREAGDLAYGLFDARGRTVAQAETGTPGHINCLAAIGLYLAKAFEGQLKPGDMLITNDPWLSAGHHFDFTVFFPIFMDGRIIGYVGSTNHHTDVGGLGVGVSATDVHEEGIWVPPMKLFEEDRPNKVLRPHPQERPHAGSVFGRSSRAGFSQSHRRGSGHRIMPPLQNPGY